jgi:predicted hydrocarbon binding protein
VHGLLHAEFRDFALERAGRARWNQVLRANGLNDRVYRLSDSYPDEELAAAVGMLAGILRVGEQDVLREFGEAAAGSLLATYGALVDPRWQALDLIEHTEEVIHRAVRLQDPNAHPPKLVTVRPDPATVRLIYDSPRRLCSVAKGILAGVGRHYDEPLTVTEEACMHDGQPVCVLVVTTP